MDIVTLGAALNGAKNQTEDYVASHFKGGANIEIVDNPDGTQTIHASGEVSSTDTVAREAIVEHVQDDDNPHKVTKSQVGLGNVDNTADLAKPISTATQTALNAKANAVDVYTKTETDALIDSIEVPTALADLTDDTTHRLVTDTEKTKLDGLANIKSVGIGLSLDDTTGELTATGGGTGGTTNYNDLSNKPQINSVVLSGNKSSADLGLADVSDIPTALSDLTEDATHRTVTDSEKSAWSAKADTSDIAVKGIKKNNVALTPDSNGIVNITVPTTAAEVNALPDSTLYGASLLLEINSSTFVVTATLKDQNGDTLGTAQTIDLPLESVVVSGSYDSATKKVVLTLQSGSTVEFSVSDLVNGLQSEITSVNKLDADLVDDSTSINKFVTSAEKTAWNSKSDFSGSYNDLTDKPTIPASVTVDQTYDSTSTNPQSGTAVAGAIVKKPGEITTGKQYTIGGQTVTAGAGAEAFNDLAGNTASGAYSHAEGKSTTASASVSHAEGVNTTASGNQSHAEGSGTKASGARSHAEGYNTTASGDYSHAEGSIVKATGIASHAEGGNTKASGVCSHAEGAGTTASSDNQHVQGTYNVEDANDTYAFIIGNGENDNARHNAFAIDWNGLIYVNGAANGVDVSALATAVSAKIGATDYATQTTGGTVKVWTTTESGETTLHISTQ